VASDPNEAVVVAVIAAASAEEHYEETGEATGRIDCPICEGKNTLNFTVSTSHYTYWLKCQTKGCVSVHADGKRREPK